MSNENTTTTLSLRLRRAVRRLDDWTLTVFNPRYPSDRPSGRS